MVISCIHYQPGASSSYELSIPTVHGDRIRLWEVDLQIRLIGCFKDLQTHLRMGDLAITLWTEKKNNIFYLRCWYLEHSLDRGSCSWTGNHKDFPLDIGFSSTCSLQPSQRNRTLTQILAVWTPPGETLFGVDNPGDWGQTRWSGALRNPRAPGPWQSLFRRLGMFSTFLIIWL